MANFTKEQKIKIAGHIASASELLMEAAGAFNEDDMADGTWKQTAQVSQHLLNAMITLAVGYQNPETPEVPETPETWE